jgi:hypothetical protein
MRRLAVSAVLLSACATGSQSPSVSPQIDQTVRVVAATGSTGSTMAIAQNDNPSQRTFAASAAQVWNALPAVYDSLSLPVTDRNAEARSIGTTSLKVRRRLGDVPLSRYLDCGDTQGSPSANSYEVVLTVATRLTPDGDSTAVATTVNALARPVFVSGEYVNCGSTRALEKRFFDILNVELRR